MTNAASVPAPTGGWNARDSLDDMEAADAVTMINLIPRSGWVEARRGSSVYTDLGGSLSSSGISTLIPYQNTKFLAAYSTSIYDITNPLAPVPLTHAAFTNSKFQLTAFQSLVILTNGADLAVSYDGTALTDLVVTGHPTGIFWGCNTFKGRAFYWEENKRSFWYAAAGAYQGALTEFDLSTQCRTGGTLVMMLTLTVDAGDGVDDFAVFVFSTGEALVYQGDDPSNALRWSSSGRFQIGEPLGIRAHCKVGGTEIILTKDGWLDISTALSGGRLSEASTYSDKIIQAAKSAANQYAAFFGWECLYYPAGNLFIANIPRSAFKAVPGSGGTRWAIESKQHARNTSTGAWCEFNGWEATTFAVWKDVLYFASGGYVYTADIGTSDAGDPIYIECIPAFNHLGANGRRKQVTLCAHLTNFGNPEYLVKDGMADYNITFQNQVVDAPFVGGAAWDVVDWDSAYWASDDEPLVETTEGWADVSAFGYAVTVSMRASLNGFSLKWYGTNYIYRFAGAI